MARVHITCGNHCQSLRPNCVCCVLVVTAQHFLNVTPRVYEILQTLTLPGAADTALKTVEHLDFRGNVSDQVPMYMRVTSCYIALYYNMVSPPYPHEDILSHRSHLVPASDVCAHSLDSVMYGVASQHGRLPGRESCHKGVPFRVGAGLYPSHV